MNVTDVTQLPDNGKLQAVVLLLCAAGRPAGYESTTMPSYRETLLCFMVKSLAGKYKDSVAMYPMDRLTAAKQMCRMVKEEWEC